MNDLVYLAPFIIADTALAIAIYRQRRRGRVLDTQPEPESELIINDPRNKRTTQTPAGYQVNELTTGPAPTLAPRRPRPQSFEDHCSQAIVEVLADAQIGFRAFVPSGVPRPAPVIGPRTLTFLLILAKPGDLEKALNLDERLAMLAAVEAARVARYRGVIGVEFQLPPDRWTELALDQPGVGQNMRLGKNTMNQAARLNLADASTTHALIAGTTGSGKTVLMTSMLYQAALADPGQQRLLVIDGKQELEAFSRLPHLVGPRAVTSEDAIKALSWTAAEIMRRSDPGADRTPLTVVIDELALLVAQDKGAVKPLANILSLGRSRNVHVIAGTQRVSADVLGNRMLTDNFTMRLVGKVVDANASALATGQTGLGANQLSGKGDFLAVTGASCARFVAAMVSDAQLAALPCAETVPTLPAETSVETLGMIETLPPGQSPVCTPPTMLAAVLASYVHAGNTWPGIGKVAEALGVGKGRAQRIRDEAGELVIELERASVGLVELNLER